MSRFWRFERRKEELREEIESHLRMEIASRVERGEPEAEARRAAMREFGNVPLVEDVTQAIWNWAWLEAVIRIVRHAMRQLRRSPGFSIAAVTIIALGIAATTAVFSIVYAVVLQPLPFARPNQLVSVGAKPLPSVSVPTIQDWQRGKPRFSIDCRLWRMVTPYSIFSRPGRSKR